MLSLINKNNDLIGKSSNINDLVFLFFLSCFLLTTIKQIKENPYLFSRLLLAVVVVGGGGSGAMYGCNVNL